MSLDILLKSILMVYLCKEYEIHNMDYPFTFCLFEDVTDCHDSR